MTRDGKQGCDVVAVELRQLVTALQRRLRAASAKHELTWSQQAVMSRLDKLGPSTTAALARAELVKPQSMGMTLAALEELGFVARSPDETDGRRWNVSLTVAGTRVVLEGRAARQEWLAQTLAAKLDGAEQRTLAEALPLLQRIVDA